MHYSLAEQKAHRTSLAEALRSGRFEQGVGWLRAKDRFCCLGVACELSGLGEWLKDEDGNYAFGDGQGRNSGDVLPDFVREYYGLADERGAYWGTTLLSGGGSLLNMNDTGKSFVQIADIIEQEPPGLIAT